MAKKVLVVDDEKLIVKGIRFSLEQDGMEVECAYDGEEALRMAKDHEYDLILLDIMLPKIDGFEVCQRIREFSSVPVVMLTAKGDDMDKILGLEYGADDYITKPFLPEELILRVKAVLKRVYRAKDMREGEIVVLGACSVDLGSGVVRWNREEDGGQYAGSGEKSDKSGMDTEVALTAKEYAILQKLAQERGRIVTIDALCDSVWREESYGYENTLIVHIRRLREKIEEDPSHPKYLLTVRGLGYRLV